MPKRFNPNSKLGQIRMQDVQKRRHTQLTSTSTTQPSSSSHHEAQVDTSTQAGKYRQAIDIFRGLTEKQLSDANMGVVIVHAAMKWGLDNFTGTAISPLPDPYTGSFTSVLNYRIRAELQEEIKANVHKLHGASYGERERMTLIWTSAPGGPFAKNENVLEWAREQKPALYKDYINEFFLSISRILYGLQEGRRLTFVPQAGAAEAAIEKIKNAYEEAGKARSKRRVQ